MCGRYTIRRTDLLPVAFEAAPLLPFGSIAGQPKYNLSPGQEVPVVRVNARGQRVIGMVRWGLIPSWTQGKPKLQPINARSETLTTSGMFRDAFARRRCLVPADGFYEWRVIDEKRKEPTFIHRTDDAPFAFAGLWERWYPEGATEPIDTVTIVTTTANATLRPLHERMPVILAKADYARWLDRNVGPEGVADLLRPAADEGWETYPVSPAVNSPKNDSPALVERAAPESDGWLL